MLVNMGGARARTAPPAEGQCPGGPARWRAVASLAREHTPEAVQSLAKVLVDDDPFVRWSAAQALGQIARQATDHRVRLAAGQAVLVAAEAREPGARAAAADAIAAWGPGAPLEPALILARDATSPVRAAAMRALGLAGSQAVQVVLPALRRALADPDLEVRRMAANAIAWCRDDSSSPALQARLRDPVAAVRAAALRALSRLSSGDYELTAIRLLRDPDPAVRVEAIRFLRLHGTMACMAPLADLEGDLSTVGEVTVGALAEEARQHVMRRRGPWPRRLWLWRRL